jgi:hypothetical protein
VTGCTRGAEVTGCTRGAEVTGCTRGAEVTGWFMIQEPKVQHLHEKLLDHENQLLEPALGWRG